MYYLNDQHQDYEYCLYIQRGHACPYINQLYVRDLDGILREVTEIEKKHNRYHQRFYIDNDFYKNAYSIGSGGTYYKFLRRRVADWEEFKRDEVYYTA